MNEKEYLRKHFFAHPETQLKSLLQKLAGETGLDCGFDNVASFEILVDDSGRIDENIGFLVVFRDSFGGIPKEGLLNHNVGSIEYSIWLKKLTLKLR
ncbi:hypothetical protein [Fluviicola chungangensis]|uniref:Uncharacterized protein n=1 Tax=Fluviicola chungangensis TaxID=2597671 RepID=A0A556N659_9FLAO|nr:hypothetical protein [Fluviicola chungangensis]TSJ47615.1 hypothetical protein FO442_00370 [Fluviicola chungangensis]